MRVVILAICLFFALPVSMVGENLKGMKFNFECKDQQFQHPFVDTDKVIDTPIRCRYVHGGFDDGTRFSFYFPEKDAFQGRFFQYITPFPESEISAQGYPASISPINFSITHGAYFVETNEGGKLDFTDASTRREPSIGAYRANAACAEFSRHIAKLIYDCSRPYGYCFGGSGGAYRTVGGIESTQGIWDGAVPFVMGSPQAIPNVFAVRMHALRVLNDKLDDIVDALEPGGSGDPYATLTTEQRQVLQECTRMGFPIRSWYGWRNMDAHGFLVLYRSVVQMDEDYFHKDFWNTPGYQGYNPSASLREARVQTPARVVRIVGQSEAEGKGLVKPLSEDERGTADRAWAALGTTIKEKPAAYELDTNISDIGMGGELVLLSGSGKGQMIQLTKSAGRYVAIAPVNSPEVLALLSVGDSVKVDNSDFLAAQTFYRHQMPSDDYYVWNQFRGYNGKPIYPQRPMLLGPLFAMGAAGCLPDGDIKSKVIVLCSVWDREAFAWHGDWYKNRVMSHIGEDEMDGNFRLWYTDRALHSAGSDNPVQTVGYMTSLFQALLDLSQWVEKDIAPSPTTNYQIMDGQVMLNDDGLSRGGIQPAVFATVNGGDCAHVKAGEEVVIRVKAQVPHGTGRIVKAIWCLDGKEYTKQQDLAVAAWSENKEEVEFCTTVTYDAPGTYFPTVKVLSERKGDVDAIFTCIPNLAKVRVVVK